MGQLPPPPPPNEKSPESLSRRAQVIAVGLGIAVIGSIVCGSYAKDTVMNYTGFAMILIGIAAFI
jgi:hypothetical protein